ncbi:LarC family nickel insertion protein [bacterium LRH843]|nr:LarC family nickel insertion protein [bacterium LRH843]
MKTLYIDCGLSGISGDMTMGALIDLGADMADIEAKIATLPIEPFTLKAEGIVKKGIYAKQFTVVEKEEERATNYRHFSTIKKMIEDAEALSDRVKEISLQIFQPIAEAEAKIHHQPMEKVHFHEVGAVDSIVDIIGTAIALEQLEIERIVAAPVVVGSGTIHIDHGVYPIPAPATLEMLKEVPIQSTTIRGELTTPTGAGILKGLVTEFGPMPSMTVEKIGYGSGQKDFPHHPNVLRVVLGESRSE